MSESKFFNSKLYIIVATAAASFLLSACGFERQGGDDRKDIPPMPQCSDSDFQDRLPLGGHTFHNMSKNKRTNQHINNQIATVAIIAKIKELTPDRLPYVQVDQYGGIITLEENRETNTTTVYYDIVGDTRDKDCSLATLVISNSTFYATYGDSNPNIGVGDFYNNPTYLDKETSVVLGIGTKLLFDAPAINPTQQTVQA